MNLCKDENYESNKDILDKIVEEDKGWRLLNSFIHASQNEIANYLSFFCL